MKRAAGPRMTLPTQLVLRTFLDDPTREMYGLEVCQLAGLQSGTITPILARFETLGWLESRNEEGDPHELGRPRRRYYQLTSDGIELAQQALAQAQAKAAPSSWRARLVEGGA